jgi:hypothetical protein
MVREPARLGSFAGTLLAEQNEARIRTEPVQLRNPS